MRIQKRIFLLILSAAIAVTALLTGGTTVKAEPINRGLTNLDFTANYGGFGTLTSATTVNDMLKDIKNCFSYTATPATALPIAANNTDSIGVSWTDETGSPDEIYLDSIDGQDSRLAETFASNSRIKIEIFSYDVGPYPDRVIYSRLFDFNSNDGYPTLTLNGQAETCDYYTTNDSDAVSSTMAQAANNPWTAALQSNSHISSDIYQQGLYYYIYLGTFSELGEKVNSTSGITEKTSTKTAHQHHYEWETIVAPTATTDGEEAYRCTCGAELYRIPMSAYNEFNKEILNDIKYAKEGGTVTVDAHQWSSFHKMVYDALQERQDVTLVLKYTDNGKKYELTIPTSKALGQATDRNFDSLYTEGSPSFIGFLKLATVYPAVEK